MKSETTVYTGRRLEDPQRDGERDTVSPIVVQVDGRDLSPEPSLAIRRKSPDGFNWGYGGSGPHQLALAILFDFTGDKLVAELFHHDFTRRHVAGWSDDWRITGKELNDFLAWANKPAGEKYGGGGR